MLDGGDFAVGEAEALGGNSGSDQHDGGEGDDEGETTAAGRFVGGGGREERADGCSHGEAADVSGVADAGKCAKGQIIGDESAEAAEHFAVDLEMRRSLFQVDEGNEHTGEAEDGAGRASSNGPRMPVNAGDAAEDAAGEISEKIREAAEELLGGAAKIPEAPHVEAEVNKTEVDKHAGEKPPPLAAESVGAEVRAKGEGLLGSRGDCGNSAEDHDGEDQHAGGDQADGDGEGRPVECFCGRRQGGADDLGALFIACRAVERRGGIADEAFEFLATGGTAMERHEEEMVAGFLETGRVVSRKTEARTKILTQRAQRTLS
jgi:hypothetical protein